MNSVEIDRVNLLDVLKIDDVSKELFLNRLEIGEFARYFEKPEYFYSQGYPDNPGYWQEYEGRKIIPLWEYSKCIYVVDVTSEDYRYLSFRIESPGESTYYSSLYHMIFEIIDFHCFQIAAEFEEALNFMRLLKFPCVERFEGLRVYDREDFEEIYDGYVEVLKNA